MEFTYDGLVRYGFGFFNPNHAAAMICMLLPSCWGLRSILTRWRFKIPIFIVEGGLYAALALTYSRTGFIALGLSAVFYLFMLFKLKGTLSFHKLLPGAAVILIFFIGVSCYSGSISRYCNWVISPDASVTNRFSLWKGAFTIFADNPQGTGTGLSGRIFTDFYQNEGSRNAYRTMVNSFLTFLTEQGVIFSFIIYGLLIFSALSALFVLDEKSLSMKYRIIIAAILASILTAIISGLASTCFDISIFNETSSWNKAMQSILLILFLLLAVGLIIFSSLKLSKKRIVILSTVSAGITAILFLFCFVAGKIYGKDFDRHAYVSGNLITVKGRNAPASSLFVLNDDEKMPRRELFRYFPDRDLLFPLTATTNIPTGTDEVLLCEDQASFTVKDEKIKLILFKPSRSAASIRHNNISAIYLSEYDEDGTNSIWESRFDSVCPIHYIR